MLEGIRAGLPQVLNLGLLEHQFQEGLLHTEREIITRLIIAARSNRCMFRLWARIQAPIAGARVLAIGELPVRR